jgi:hypothetical protein
MGGQTPLRLNGDYRNRKTALWVAAAALLTAATAVQIAIAIIVLTRPSRDDAESAERARPATVSLPSVDEQLSPPGATLPFATREDDVSKRAAAGSRPHARGKSGGSLRTKVERPKPRRLPSPPPPPPPATTAARADNPAPPLSETATATGRPPPQAVTRSPGGGGDDGEDGDDGDDDDEEQEDDGEDDDGGDDGGGDEDDGGGDDDD